jgi:predicted transcriptional regulator
MNVTLPQDQQKWLEAEVAAGRFASVDEAVAAAVADFMVLSGIESGLADMTAGRLVPHDAAMDEIDAAIAAAARSK